MGKKRFGAAFAGKSRFSIETAELSRTNGGKIDIRLDSEGRRTLAAEVGVSSITKLRFVGEIKFEEPSDWKLSANLGATVVQPCVGTLEPVRTRIESAVERRYSPANVEPAPGSCVPMPDDETLEPLGDEIDLLALICESLVLELPLYPKRGDAEPEAERSSWPEQDAGKIDKLDRPFSILSEFRKQLER